MIKTIKGKGVNIMRVNKKLVDMLVRGTEHFELVGELDTYGNGKILEVNARDKVYLVKSNWQGTATDNVVLANTVKKELRQFVAILKEKGFKEL
jgi:hypothetical protein